MAGMPPIPMDDSTPLEGAAPTTMDTPSDTGDLDPQFAADISEAFPDLDDKQLSALQRAIMGLMGR